MKDLLANEAQYREGDVSSVVGRLKAFADAGPHDLHACKLVTLLAAMRARDDLDYLALDCIDRWLTRPLEPEEKGHAYSFKAIALYSLNRVREAINASREAVRIVRGIGEPVLIAGRLLTTAYFLAEVAGKADAPESNEAKELVNEAVSLIGDIQALLPTRRDTVGFVKIVTGTEAEVREGLEICRQACAAMKDKERGEAFFSLAERRAFRRLLGFD